MNFIELAKKRYTTKKYDSSKKIPEDVIVDLQEILRLAPSSINSQPWKFTFVSDDTTKNQLAEASYFNAAKIKDASHLVVFSVLSNIDMFENQIASSLPAGSVGYYNQFIKPNTPVEIRSWLSQQVYLSLGFFLAACASMGIDSTPMEGIEFDKYATILKMDNYRSLFAVAIGYRDREDSNQPSIKPKSRLEKRGVIVSI